MTPSVKRYRVYAGASDASMFLGAFANLKDARSAARSAHYSHARVMIWDHSKGEWLILTDPPAKSIGHPEPPDDVLAR